MSQEIIYDTNCDRCLEHKTELGVWLSIKMSVIENFPELVWGEKVNIMICWFNNYKLDERTKLIQGYKKSNIKAINDK